MCELALTLICKAGPNPFSLDVPHGARPREAGCLLETLASCRAAGTGREDPQPDTNPSQLWLAVKCGRSVRPAKGSREQKSGCGRWTLNHKPQTLNAKPLVGPTTEADKA